MLRLTTRGYATAQAIGRHEPFTTSGALFAETGLPWRGSGWLTGPDRDAYRRDLRDIVYTVYSYATPIAWATRDGRTHKVWQKFSLTTTRHQSNLYLF